MKKTVYIILITCLFIGISLIVLEQLSIGKDKHAFDIPLEYSKEIIDLSEHKREDDLLFTGELETPSVLSIILQSDTRNKKTIKIVSDSKVLGKGSNEYILNVRNTSKNKQVYSTQMLGKGKYSVYLTSEKINGTLTIAYHESPVDQSIYDRFCKIDMGELNNPPEGYIEIYSVDLEGLNYIDEKVYTISFSDTKTIGLSAYTSINQGDFSLDLIGESLEIGMLDNESKICDQLEITLMAGEYQLKLNCKDADGQVYIFMKE